MGPWDSIVCVDHFAEELVREVILLIPGDEKYQLVQTGGVQIGLDKREIGEKVSTLLGDWKRFDQVLIVVVIHHISMVIQWRWKKHSGRLWVTFSMFAVC